MVAHIVPNAISYKYSPISGDIVVGSYCVFFAVVTTTQDCTYIMKILIMLFIAVLLFPLLLGNTLPVLIIILLTYQIFLPHFVVIVHYGERSTVYLFLKGFPCT